MSPALVSPPRSFRLVLTLYLFFPHCSCGSSPSFAAGDQFFLEGRQSSLQSLAQHPALMVGYLIEQFDCVS